MRPKARREGEPKMAVNLRGSDYKGGNGTPKLEEAGTYPCTLAGASVYLNEKYQSDEQVHQITLIWDTGLIAENDDGEEVPVMIYDAWLLLSLNEKSNLVKRLTALAGGTLDAENANLGLDGVKNLNEIKHWKDGRTDLDGLTLNGEDLFGREALVTIVLNDKGYAKVTNVSAPLKAPAKSGGKLKTRTAAPEGVPL